MAEAPDKVINGRLMKPHARSRSPSSRLRLGYIRRRSQTCTSYMKVVRPSEAPSEEMTGGIFTGTIRMTPLINADTGAQLAGDIPSYPPPGEALRLTGEARALMME